jgi:hypothetical protein
MFPKRRRVTARRDFDNESAGRREVVAIFKNRNFVPTGASNPRQAHKEKGSQALLAESDLLDAAFAEFHILILAEAWASSASLAFKIDGTTLASSSSSRRINR